MAKIKIPELVKRFIRNEGVDDLPQFLEFLSSVRPTLELKKDFMRDGLLRVLSIAGVAATALTNLRPEAGKRWLVLDAAGYHDDSSDRSCIWQYTDGTNTINMDEGLTLGASEKKSITSKNQNATTEIVTHPIILTRDVYAQWNVVSIGSGKKGYIHALVLELDE